MVASASSDAAFRWTRRGSEWPYWTLVSSQQTHELAKASIAVLMVDGQLALPQGLAVREDDAAMRLPAVIWSLVRLGKWLQGVQPTLSAALRSAV